MKMTIESTNEFAEVHGVRCRVWKGKTANGCVVAAFIPLVAGRDADVLAEFDGDLIEQDPRAMDDLARMLRKRLG